MNMNFNFSNPTNLIFGAGKLEELGSELLAKKNSGKAGNKALLLISNGTSVKIRNAGACGETAKKCRSGICHLRQYP